MLWSSPGSSYASQPEKENLNHDLQRIGVVVTPDSAVNWHTIAFSLEPQANVTFADRPTKFISVTTDPSRGNFGPDYHTDPANEIP